MPELEDWSSRVAAPERCVVEGAQITVRSPLQLQVRSGRTLAIGEARSARPRPDRALVAGLRRAHAELEARGLEISSRDPSPGDAKGIDDPYLRKLTTLAFLAPDIQQAIIAGHHPAGMTLAGLLSARLPIDWDAQRKMLGFAGAGPDSLLQAT